jgi:hypothetical protein
MARESEPVPSILVTPPLEEFQLTIIPSILVTSPLEEFQSSLLPSIFLSRELHPEDEEEDTSSNHFRYWVSWRIEVGNEKVIYCIPALRGASLLPNYVQ